MTEVCLRRRFWSGRSADLVIEQVFMRLMKSSGEFTRRTGITEIQRLVWVMSRSICNLTNKLMLGLTNIQHETSDQHSEFSTSRQMRDCKDTQKVIEFLQKANPFEGNGNILRNTATDVCAATGVNNTFAKEVGEKIISKMKDKSIKDFTPRRIDQCVLMSSKTSDIIENQGTIDPALLFQRLVTVTRRSSNDESTYFKYELCSLPMSLFDRNGFIRNSGKHELAKSISSLYNYDPTVQVTDGTLRGAHYVLDGGALLHRIPWSKYETYSDICKKYADYIHNKYGSEVFVVFDGYTGPSTKDMAHMKRTKLTGKNVHFTLNMKLTTSKEEFLSSKKNKVEFIKALSNVLEENQLTIIQANGDADLLIVKTAIERARNKTTVLIGEDTDLLVLLLHYSSEIKTSLFLKSEGKKGCDGKIWDILKLQQLIGGDKCKSLLFSHAFLGCDTTSKPYGIGKAVGLKLLKSCYAFHELAKIFSKTSNSKEDVENAGEKAMILVYGGNTNETLDDPRYKLFQRKVSVATSFVNPSDIPPTSTATKNHSRRCYLQIQCWLGNDSLDPTEWGWLTKNDILYPVLPTELPPAPPELLKVVKCGCTGSCNSLRCSCRKNGILCSVVCKNCKGISCLNSEKSFGENESDEDEVKNI